MNSRVKGENIGNIISLFSAASFGTIVCSFTQMTNCLRVGRKNNKSTLKFFEFRGRLKWPACLDISEIKAAVGNTVERNWGGRRGK